MGVRTRRTMGEVAGSVLCFLTVLTALVAIDVRVRERVVMLFAGTSGDSVASWGDRIDSLVDAVVQAASDQSINNAPMLIFAIVAAVLVVFMMRT